MMYDIFSKHIDLYLQDVRHIPDDPYKVYNDMRNSVRILIEKLSSLGLPLLEYCYGMFIKFTLDKTEESHS